MITESDKQKIKEISKKYNVKHVLLFGSSLHPRRKSHDIDIAVEGISEKVFFKYYGDLLYNLSKPVDIVDISQPSIFAKMVRKEGILLYG